MCKLLHSKTPFNADNGSSVKSLQCTDVGSSLYLHKALNYASFSASWAFLRCPSTDSVLHCGYCPVHCTIPSLNSTQEVHLLLAHCTLPWTINTVPFFHRKHCSINCILTFSMARLFVAASWMPPINNGIIKLGAGCSPGVMPPFLKATNDIHCAHSHRCAH